MRRVISTATVLVAAVAISACGDKSNLPSNESASVKSGAQLFKARCSGCHTMDTVNALGGATKVRDREVVDGPNFNVRKETKDNVLYAIRNGGFSAAIMPQNIVVGKDADMVAQFLSKYAGVEQRKVLDTGTNKAPDTSGN